MQISFYSFWDIYMWSGCHHENISGGWRCMLFLSIFYCFHARMCKLFISSWQKSWSLCSSWIYFSPSWNLTTLMEHYRLVTLQRYSYEAITFCLSGKKYLPGCSNNNFLILIPTSQIFMILLLLQVVICLMLRKTLSLVSYVQVRVVLLSLLSSSIALLCSVYSLISMSSLHLMVW
jgi:hypothetical protein